MANWRVGFVSWIKGNVLFTRNCSTVDALLFKRSKAPRGCRASSLDIKTIPLYYTWFHSDGVAVLVLETFFPFSLTLYTQLNLYDWIAQSWCHCLLPLVADWCGKHITVVNNVNRRKSGLLLYLLLNPEDNLITLFIWLIYVMRFSIEHLKLAFTNT